MITPYYHDSMPTTAIIHRLDLHRFKPARCPHKINLISIPIILIPTKQLISFLHHTLNNNESVIHLTHCRRDPRGRIEGRTFDPEGHSSSSVGC
mmetsp:Transcript_27228/g.65431  ORF Transcript_27228/g.65431 Transcript_27228/m.65431 type:complete len:94 (+) Transcript_27228:363-644(+)